MLLNGNAAARGEDVGDELAQPRRVQQCCTRLARRAQRLQCPENQHQGSVDVAVMAGEGDADGKQQQREVLRVVDDLLRVFAFYVVCEEKMKRGNFFSLDQIRV